MPFVGPHSRVIKGPRRQTASLHWVRAECDARLGTLASQLDLSTTSLAEREEGRNEDWSAMWTVHQKVTAADRKYK